MDDTKKCASCGDMSGTCACPKGDAPAAAPAAPAADAPASDTSAQ